MTTGSRVSEFTKVYGVWIAAFALLMAGWTARGTLWDLTQGPTPEAEQAINDLNRDHRQLIGVNQARIARNDSVLRELIPAIRDIRRTLWLLADLECEQRTLTVRPPECRVLDQMRVDQDPLPRQP